MDFSGFPSSSMGLRKNGGGLVLSFLGVVGSILTKKKRKSRGILATRDICIQLL